jgi:hypothetical protein
MASPFNFLTEEPKNSPTVLRALSVTEWKSANCHLTEDRANFFSTSRGNKLAPIGNASSLKS